MDYLRFRLISIALTVVAVVVLNTEVGTETVVQAYYTHEPLLDRPEIDWPCRTRISCHHLVWAAH